MEINFDSRGNLKPYEKIEISLETFRKNFVDDFAYENKRRIEIFQNYMDFLQKFKQEITEDFTQWIDGSFVTKKKAPRDIDFVTLIDYKNMKNTKPLLKIIQKATSKKYVWFSRCLCCKNISFRPFPMLG